MKYRVSIIMAFHNAQAYIYHSVKSIVEQRFADFEFIIINDNSTDSSVDIVTSFNDSRIMVYNNKEKLGLTRSLNIALSKCNGSFIARMDADDIAMPERLEKQLQFMVKCEDIGILGTSFYEIDENGAILGEVYMPNSDYEIRKKIYAFNPFLHSSVMIRREVLEEVGPYNENFYYAQDYELWFRILKKSKGANLVDLLMMRRKHKNTLTMQNLNLQSLYAYKACNLGKHCIRPSLMDEIRILRYLFMSKFPKFIPIFLNRFRIHNLQYKLRGYYRRDCR